MPKVVISEAEEQRRFLSNVIKANMIRRDMPLDNLIKRVGTSKSTHYKRLQSPDEMTLREFKGYVKALHISDTDLLYAVRGGDKPCE